MNYHLPGCRKRSKRLMDVVFTENSRNDRDPDS